MLWERLVTEGLSPDRPDATIASDRTATEVRVRGELDAWTARSLCQAIEGEVSAGATDVAINLEAVKSCDVVGLAALLQSSRLCARRGVGLSVLPGAALHPDLLKAQLFEELPLVTALFGGGPAVDVADSRSLGGPQFLAHTPRLGLRPPTWDELPLFERWANDPPLDQMVGSELLYRCRHLGPYHPDFVSAVLSDPTSLTLLVEPLDPPRAPVGFVRLYGIQLAQQFAFLETAVASPESLRRGWGIEASRLLLAYGLDALRLHRIEAKVYAYNLLSANSLKRNGFRPEGVLRKARVYGGQRWDILVYSILHDEMKEQRTREQFPYMGLWTRPC